MRMFLWACLILGMAGCGGEGNKAITNPTELPPMSASDLEELKKQEAEVADQERGRPLPKTKTR